MGYAPTFQADLTGVYQTTPWAYRRRQDQHDLARKQIEVLGTQQEGMEDNLKTQEQMRELRDLQMQVMQYELERKQRIVQAESLMAQSLGKNLTDLPKKDYETESAGLLQEVMRVAGDDNAAEVWRTYQEFKVQRDAMRVGQAVEGRDRLKAQMDELRKVAGLGTGTGPEGPPESINPVRLDELQKEHDRLDSMVQKEGSWTPLGNGYILHTGTGETKWVGVTKVGKGEMAVSPDLEIYNQEEKEPIRVGNTLLDPYTYEPLYEGEAAQGSQNRYTTFTTKIDGKEQTFWFDKFTSESGPIEGTEGAATAPQATDNRGDLNGPGHREGLGDVEYATYPDKRLGIDMTTVTPAKPITVRGFIDGKMRTLFEGRKPFRFPTSERGAFDDTDFSNPVKSGQFFEKYVLPYKSSGLTGSEEPARGLTPDTEQPPTQGAIAPGTPGPGTPEDVLQGANVVSAGGQPVDTPESSATGPRPADRLPQAWHDWNAKRQQQRDPETVDAPPQSWGPTTYTPEQQAFRKNYMEARGDTPFPPEVVNHPAMQVGPEDATHAEMMEQSAVNVQKSKQKVMGTLGPYIDISAANVGSVGDKMSAAIVQSFRDMGIDHEDFTEGSKRHSNLLYQEIKENAGPIYTKAWSTITQILDDKRSLRERNIRLGAIAAVATIAQAHAEHAMREQVRLGVGRLGGKLEQVHGQPGMFSDRLQNDEELIAAHTEKALGMASKSVVVPDLDTLRDIINNDIGGGRPGETTENFYHALNLFAVLQNNDPRVYFFQTRNSGAKFRAFEKWRKAEFIKNAEHKRGYEMRSPTDKRVETTVLDFTRPRHGIGPDETLTFLQYKNVDEEGGSILYHPNFQTMQYGMYFTKQQMEKLSDGNPNNFPLFFKLNMPGFE